jgi:hypothetical protein
MNIRLGKQLIAAIAVFSIGLFLFLDTTAQSGGPYEIKSSVIGGGGGTSCSTDPCAGATYSLTGTIGQAVAGGPASGPPNTYNLYHGFWQTTPGAGGWGVTGTVAYGTPVTSAIKFVPGVLLSAAGTPMVTTNTDSTGAYGLFGLGSGAYTVTLSKTGQVNGIESFDAVLAAQFAVGLISLTPNQQIAADGDGDTSVSSFDAVQIARYAVGLPPIGSSIAGTWKFVPASRNYPSLSNDLSGENFDGLLVGDVNGNWDPTILRSAEVKDIQGSETPDRSSGTKPTTISTGTSSASNLGGILVSLPANAMGNNGTVVSIPIFTNNLTGQNVFSYDLMVSFNPAILSPVLPTCHVRAGTISGPQGPDSEQMSINCSSPAPGQLRVGAFNGAYPRESSGALVFLRFNVLGANGQSTPLTWTATPAPTNCPPGFCYNAGTPDSNPVNGLFTVGVPTASNALVSGRVVDADGRAIMRALVTLTGPDGSTRTVSTGLMGTFRFPNVSTGRTYILSVGAKNRTFAAGTQLITLLDDATGIVFIADSPPKQ